MAHQQVAFDLLQRIEDLTQVFQDADSRAALTHASESVIEAQHYRALKALRSLLPREDRLLAIRPN